MKQALPLALMDDVEKMYLFHDMNQAWILR